MYSFSYDFIPHSKVFVSDYHVSGFVVDTAYRMVKKTMIATAYSLWIGGIGKKQHALYMYVNNYVFFDFETI